MARLRGTGTLPKVLFLNHFCPFLCAWQGKLIHVTCTIATRCILLHSGGLTGHFTWIQKSCICVYTPQLTSFTGQWIAATPSPDLLKIICSWCDWTVVDINQCDSYFFEATWFLKYFLRVYWDTLSSFVRVCPGLISQRKMCQQWRSNYHSHT